MAAVFHHFPALHGRPPRGRPAASERLPALLRALPQRSARVAPHGLHAVDDAAPSWPMLEHRVRRALWACIAMVVAVDLIGTFVLHVH